MESLKLCLVYSGFPVYCFRSLKLGTVFTGKYENPDIMLCFTICKPFNITVGYNNSIAKYLFFLLESFVLQIKAEHSVPSSMEHYSPSSNQRLEETLRTDDVNIFKTIFFLFMGNICLKEEMKKYLMIANR